MKDVAIDIENFLDAGMSEKDIATKTGVPIEQVREIKKYSREGKELAKDVEIARRIEKEELGKMGLQRTPNRSGGGGMNPADIEKVPGKRPLKMKKGGMVSASKRADGCAVKGKTKGRFV
jgi:hypothetical protein